MQCYYPVADRSEEVEENIAVAQNNIPILTQIALALGISGVVVGFSMWVSPMFENLLKTDINLDVLVITIVILILANVMHKFLQKLEDIAFQIGMYMLYFFLAVVGALCDIELLFSSSLNVLLFATIILVVHLIISLVAGKILKFSLEEISIASAANVGGVTISSPMAATFKMKQAVTPAILIGILGNVIGTILGIAVGLLLK